MQAIMFGWILYAFIVQLFINRESLKESNNPVFNKMMDDIFGEDDKDDKDED